MAGYYDPNKDYSKAISEAKAAGKDTSQLEAERQNKIDDKYGGKEPNMYGSDKTFSQASRDNDRDTISNAITISNSRGGNSSNSGSGGSSGGSTDLVKGPGYVTGGYTMGVNGSPILNDNPYWKGGVSASKADMSRRPDLANGYATSNGYTVFYDEDGYAYKAVKGAADYLPHKDYYVEQGSYGGGNLWTDEEMMSAADLQRIASIRAQMQAGQITGDQANQLANQIRSGYGYTIDKSGNVYDSGQGTSVYLDRVKQNLSVGELNDAEKQYLELMFKEQNTTDTDALLAAYSALQDGKYDPNIMYENVVAGQGLQNALNAAGLSSAAGLQTGGYSDMTKYLEDMFAQNLESELAALKSAYDTNVAELESQNDKIAEQYRAARNQAAAQNEIEKQSMNERALATGLNTGTSGQIALAQNMAYQGNLGNLYASQAQDQAAGNRALAELLREYNTNVNRTTANINAQKAEAIYNELIRQEEMAAAAAQRDAAERAAALERELANQENTRKYALTMLQNGMRPDDATLAAAGLSPTEAELWYQYGVQANAPKVKAVKTPAAEPEPELDPLPLSNPVPLSTNVPDYAEIKTKSEAGDYGPAYGLVLGNIQNMRARGASLDAMADRLIQEMKNGNINEDGVKTIMQALGINP